MDDYELIRKLQDGDNTAFKTIVETYQDKVLNTCYRFLYHKEDAEDIAQEVFVEVYQSIASFRREAKLATWIYRIAVNKSLDFLRKKKRKKRAAVIKSLFDLESGGREMPLPNDNDPADKIEQEERLGILQEAISKLPENQRIAFTLSKCEGLGNNEIADIIGKSVSSIESLVHRAKKKLRGLLYKYFEQDLLSTGRNNDD